MDENSDCVVLLDDSCKVVLHRPGVPPHEHFDHRVDIVSGPFQGTFTASAYANAYPRFRAELSELYETLNGEAALGGYENLEIGVKADGLGHFALSILAIEDHHRPIRLSFTMFLDQTQLPGIIAAIERVFIRSTTSG